MLTALLKRPVHQHNGLCRQNPLRTIEQPLTTGPWGNVDHIDVYHRTEGLGQFGVLHQPSGIEHIQALRCQKIRRLRRLSPSLDGRQTDLIHISG